MKNISICRWFRGLVNSDVVNKLTSEIVAKLLFLCIVSLLSFVVTLHFITGSAEAEFLHKTWKTKDGSVTLYGDKLSHIEIVGRPEGLMVIEITKHAENTNRYEGDLFCADHGGLIGRVLLELEPFNQIRVKTLSGASGQYYVNEILRIQWPTDDGRKVGEIDSGKIDV